MKRISRVVMNLSVLACSSPLVAQVPPSCDPENYDTRPRNEQSVIEKGYKSEPAMAEMVAYLNVPPAAVTPKIVEYMLRCKMPVAGAQALVVEADYGTEQGALAKYKLKARVYVLPAGDSATVVRMVGVEEGLETKPVTNKNSGRSGTSWMAMHNVMKQLLTDPTLKADREKSTKISAPFLFADSGSVKTGR